MEKAILIHFDSVTGEVHVEAFGFEGLNCLEATQPFEEALGIVQQSDRSYKPEAQQQIRTASNQQHRLRQ